MLLTDDSHIHVLNKEWRKKDKATDVLSFPQYTVEELRGLPERLDSLANAKWSLGDIIISIETAQRQADSLGTSLEDEVARLFIHGIVHLFGYDHEISEKEARRMRRIERILLTR